MVEVFHVEHDPDVSQVDPALFHVEQAKKLDETLRRTFAKRDRTPKKITGKQIFFH